MNARPKGKTKILFSLSMFACSLRSREKFRLKTAKVFTGMEAKPLRLESRRVNPAKALLISLQDY
jgi:hypothetical protein